MPVPRGLSASVRRNAVTPLLRSRPLPFVARLSTSQTLRIVATPNAVPASYAERFSARTGSGPAIRLQVGFPEVLFLPLIQAPEPHWTPTWRRGLLENISRVLSCLPLQVLPSNNNKQNPTMIFIPMSDDPQYRIPVFRAIQNVQSMVHLLALPPGDQNVKKGEVLTLTEILAIKNVLALPPIDNDTYYCIFDFKDFSPRRVNRDIANNAIRDLMDEQPKSELGKLIWSMLHSVLIRRIGTHANEKTYLSNFNRIIKSPVSEDPRGNKIEMRRPLGYPPLVLPRIVAIEQVLKDHNELLLWMEAGVNELRKGNYERVERTAPIVAPPVKYHIPHTWRPILANVPVAPGRRRVSREHLEKVVSTAIVPEDAPPATNNLDVSWSDVAGMYEKKFGSITQKRSFSSSARILSKASPASRGQNIQQCMERIIINENAEPEEGSDSEPAWWSSLPVTENPNPEPEKLELKAADPQFIKDWRQRLVNNIERILEAPPPAKSITWISLMTKGRGVEVVSLLEAIRRVKNLIHLLARSRSWEPRIEMGVGPFYSTSELVATKNVLELIASNLQYKKGQPPQLLIYDQLDELPKKASPMYAFYQIGRLVTAVPESRPIRKLLKKGLTRCYGNDPGHPLNRVGLTLLFLKATPVPKRVVDDLVPLPWSEFGRTSLATRHEAIVKVLKWAKTSMSELRDEIATTFKITISPPPKYSPPPQEQVWRARTSSMADARYEARKAAQREVRARKGIRGFSTYSRASAVAFKGLRKSDGKIRAELEVKEREYLEGFEHAIRPETNPMPAGGVAFSDTGDVGGDSMDFESYGAQADDPGEIVNFSAYKKLALGDMCELRSVNGTSLLALYIGTTPGQTGTSDFLSVLGRVVPYFEVRVAFRISGFAPVEEIEAFATQLSKMQEFYGSHGKMIHWAIPQRFTRNLVKPMQEFRQRAETILKHKMSEFGKLWDQIADEKEKKWLTTPEAAEMLFGKDAKDEHIYAAHLALMADGLRYIGDKGFHRHTQRFEVRSRQDLAMIDSVTEWVRMAALDQKLTPQGNMERRVPPTISQFIEKCRVLIDHARAYCVTNPNGKAPCQRIELKELSWTRSEKLFIDYLKSRLESYGLQPTPIEGLAPFLVRLTERYPGDKLDANIIHQFLYEIGARAQWHNNLLRRPNLRIPQYAGLPEADAEEARYQSLKNKEFAQLGLTDQLAGLRKDWGNMIVYAVDDASAHEIDDGVSIERVNENETWIHVHIANPSAFLPADHWISEIAQKRATTKYLDPFVFPMFPEIIGKTLGVQSGAPVLTISTKVDRDGEVLDYDIQPGLVRHVKRVTYKQFHELLGLAPHDSYSIAVGAPFNPSPDPPVDLTPTDIANLKDLQTVAHSTIRRRVRAGSIDLKNAIYDAHIDKTSTNLGYVDESSSFPILYKDHPSVKLQIYRTQTPRDAQDLVAEFMILANSTVALYSTKHSIVAPFRAVELNTSRQDILDYYHNKILPARDEFGVTGRVNQDLPYFLLLATGSIKSVATPQVLMGLPEGYVKATSPLRRYSDLLVHWNLQAHMLGQQTLPFPTNKLEEIVTGVDLAERMAQYASRQTASMWHASAIKRVLDTKVPLPWEEVMEVVITQAKEHPTPSMGFARELASKVKVQFSDTAQMKEAQAAGIVLVRVTGVKMGERLISTECVAIGGKNGETIVRS